MHSEHSFTSYALSSHLKQGFVSLHATLLCQLLHGAQVHKLTWSTALQSYLQLIFINLPGWCSASLYTYLELSLINLLEAEIYKPIWSTVL